MLFFKTSIFVKQARIEKIPVFNRDFGLNIELDFSQRGFCFGFQRGIGGGGEINGQQLAGGADRADFLPLAAARRLRALMSAVLILLMAETLAAVLCGVGLAAAESCLMAAAQSCACVLAGQPLFSRCSKRLRQWPYRSICS